MRGRNKPWAKTFIASHPELIYDKNQKIDTLEIGIGKGDFLISNAKYNPLMMHVGVELNTSIFAVAMKKVVNENVKNVFLLNVPANQLKDYIAPSSVQKIYLNFSDPWPQNGYRKRRLVHPLHLEVFESLLQDHGFIYFKTDNEKLFEFGVDNFKQRNYKIQFYSRDYQLESDDFLTEYEAKFRQQKLPIYRCIAQVNRADFHDWMEKMK